MFGWFSQRCPVNSLEQAWLESKMMWLAQRIGVKSIRQSDTLLASEVSQRCQYGIDPQAGQRVLDYLSEVYQIKRGVRFEVATDLADGSRYEDGKVYLDAALLPDFQLALSQLAQRLAEHYLIDQGYCQPDDTSMPSLCGLLPVYFGLGVPVANTAIREVSHTDGDWVYWSLTVFGNLPARMLGYALALRAWLRDESLDAAWAKKLRPDAEETFRLGFKYLDKTGSSILRVNEINRNAPSRLPPVPQLLDQFRNGAASDRIAIMWQFQEHGDVPLVALQAVRNVLNARDAHVRSVAARTLGIVAGETRGPDREQIIKQLVRQCHDNLADVRLEATRAVGALGTLTDPLVSDTICERLDDEDTDVAHAAADGLCSLSEAAHEIPPHCDRLLVPAVRALQRSVRLCDYELQDVVTDALRNIWDAPPPALQEYLRAADEYTEFCELVWGEPNRQQDA